MCCAHRLPLILLAQLPPARPHPEALCSNFCMLHLPTEAGICTEEEEFLDGAGCICSRQQKGCQACGPVNGEPACATSLQLDRLGPGGTPHLCRIPPLRCRRPTCTTG